MGLRITFLQNSQIYTVRQDAANGRLIPSLSFACRITAIIQIIGNTQRPKAFAHCFFKHQSYDFCLIFTYAQIVHGLIFLVEPFSPDQFIPIWTLPACKKAFFGQLADTCPDPLGGFCTLASSLPVADIVGELVNMVVKTLLPFTDAPDSNAVPCQPFHNKRRLIVPPSDPVKHIDQKDIKFSGEGSLPDLQNGVPLLHGQLIARNPFFGKFLFDLPTSLLGKCAAGNALHRDIVFLYLSPV